ncbi:MAG: hypothetical protein HZB51_30050 [Chloroflexi bacterium]|nr:hypothetical protein [Chloroflexota bacterium]
MTPFRFLCLCVISIALAAQTPRAQAASVTTHPRLWLTQNDLPRLRGWAVPSNSVYAALQNVATSLKSKMDDGSLYTGDPGCNWCYVQFPVEGAMEIFAFMSLIESDAGARADYANRAHTLLMYVMNQAVLGPTAADSHYRYTGFSTNMRSLFYGEAFPLTADWIYSTLSASDKQTIRAVFLRWQAENLIATTSGLDHPEPVWTYNDPVLLNDPDRFRTSANNFFNTHMNQLGLMALAFDPADDPGDANVNGDQVRDYLPDAIGAWLYLHHHMMETLSAGGVPPEGMAYGPTGNGRAGEFLLALYTAGEMDTSKWGPQVSFTTPFWNSLVPAYSHSVSPAPTVLEAWKGPAYLVADHGDTYDIYLKAVMTLFGTRGLHAYYTNDASTLNAIRWIMLNLEAGGAAKLATRAGDLNYLRDCILYFLLFDPNAPAPTDPRPGLPLDYYAVGSGHLLARTSWNANAAWFNFKLSWNSIDHQHNAGNGFEFYRHGEWLTKSWPGYGYYSGGSDYKNTLALQNSPPNSMIAPWGINYTVGSQYAYSPAGDPNWLTHSSTSAYTYALGDATNLYNNTQANSTDIVEATRSIFWLKPDQIAVYDRAASQTAGRFKRFWLMMPITPTISGLRATTTTPGGQKLVVDTLLPVNAALSADGSIPNGAGYNETANYEPMTSRLKVEAPGSPTTTRFMHVLQGLDANVPPLAVAQTQSTSGTAFDGAIIGDTVVLFPTNVGHVPTGTPFNGINFAGTSYAVPTTVKKHFITGLTPNGIYNFSFQNIAGNLQVTVSAGTQYQADGGGVLSYPAPTPDWRSFLPFIVR